MKRLLLLLSLMAAFAAQANATGYYWVPPSGPWLLIGNVMDGYPMNYVYGTNYNAMVRLYNEARNRQPYLPVQP